MNEDTPIEKSNLVAAELIASELDFLASMSELYKELYPIQNKDNTAAQLSYQIQQYYSTSIKNIRDLFINADNTKDFVKDIGHMVHFIENNLNAPTIAADKKPTLYDDTIKEIAADIGKTDKLSLGKILSYFNTAEFRTSMLDLALASEILLLETEQKYKNKDHTAINFNSTAVDLIIPTKRIKNLPNIDDSLSEHKQYCKDALESQAQMYPLFHKLLAPKALKAVIKNQLNNKHNDDEIYYGMNTAEIKNDKAINLIMSCIDEVKKTHKSLPLQVKKDLLQYIKNNKLTVTPELKRRLITSKLKKHMLNIKDYLTSSYNTKKRLSHDNQNPPSDRKHKKGL